jgi:hypothetical protein
VTRTGRQQAGLAHPSRPIRFLDPFGERHEGGRLYSKSVGERQQQLVGRVEVSRLELVDAPAEKPPTVTTTVITPFPQMCPNPFPESE